MKSNEPQKPQLNIGAVSSRLLLRIASDLQKELIRQTNEVVKQDIQR